MSSSRWMSIGRQWLRTYLPQYEDCRHRIVHLHRGRRPFVRKQSREGTRQPTPLQALHGAVCNIKNEIQLLRYCFLCLPTDNLERKQRFREEKYHFEVVLLCFLIAGNKIRSIVFRFADVERSIEKFIILLLYFERSIEIFLFDPRKVICSFEIFIFDLRNVERNFEIFLLESVSSVSPFHPIFYDLRRKRVGNVVVKRRI